MREVPAPDNELPSMALGAAGGGSVAVDAREAGGVTAVETWFQVDLALPKDARVSTIGSHAYVRIDHPPRALAPLLFDASRRLFMGRLGV
jgi:putative peptide zinc metalloprotease protein